MPKSHALGGPTYLGHTDVSSPDTTGPEWVIHVEAVEAPTEPAAPEPAEATHTPSRRTTQRKAGRA